MNAHAEVRPRTLRCAVYTRKSSEEGLEQSFNSLHAQRHACEAYVQSQAGEGWTALAQAYDDGGISGATMERPGLKRLLADIEAGKIDVVVVYKVDRLTRSLVDFARIVEAFDRCGVPFVSVTQAFNTTTSMGRLTLNVLLSFAQFEREVTGERIRDKIRLSKEKGMWMGGVLPLGYEKPFIGMAEAMLPGDAVWYEPTVEDLCRAFGSGGPIWIVERRRAPDARRDSLEAALRANGSEREEETFFDDLLAERWSPQHCAAPLTGSAAFSCARRSSPRRPAPRPAPRSPAPAPIRARAAR